MDDRESNPVFDSLKNRSAIASLLAPIPIAAVVGLLAVSEAADDAHIIYRYVERWVHGLGLTFNNGERVEGYTSLLWTFSLGLLAKLTGGRPPVVAVVANYILLLLTLGALWTLLKATRVDRRSARLILIAYSGSYLYFRIAFLGLEFGLYGFLLTGFFAALFHLEAAERQHSRPFKCVLLGALGGLLFATRPEAIVLLPSIAVAGMVLKAARVLRLSYAAYLWMLCGWVAPVVGVLMWRLQYYGEWVPNSVIAKSVAVGTGRRAIFGQHVADGMTYLLSAYAQNPAWVIFIGGAAYLATRRQLPGAVVMLLIPISLAHAVAVQNGGDWMPYHRLLNAYSPLMLAGFAVIASHMAMTHHRSAKWLMTVFCGLYLFVNVAAVDSIITWPARLAAAVHRAPPISGFARAYRDVGRSLDQVWIPGDVLAAEGIGWVAYAAPNVYVHDPFGLTDRVVAHDRAANPTPYGRTNWHYTMSLRPAVILLHYWPHQQSWHRMAPDYPEGYRFYTLESDAANGFVLFAIIRWDREAHYGPALRRLGGKERSRTEVDAYFTRSGSERRSTPPSAGA